MVKIPAEDITSGSGSNCSNDVIAESDGDNMMFYHCKDGQLKGTTTTTTVCYMITHTFSGLKGQWHLSENRTVRELLIRCRGRRLDMTQLPYKLKIGNKSFLPVNLSKISPTLATLDSGNLLET